MILLLEMLMEIVNVIVSIFLGFGIAFHVEFIVEMMIYFLVICCFVLDNDSVFGNVNGKLLLLLLFPRFL